MDGWSLFCGHPKGATSPRRRQTAACFPRTKYFLGGARRCRSCRSASQRTIAFHGGVKWTPRRARVFPEFGVQSCKRLPQDHERGDGKGRALARRHMAPVGGTARFPGPDSRTVSALFIIRGRNAGLRFYPVDTCSYCHACRCSSYRRTGACISRRRTSTAPL